MAKHLVMCWPLDKYMEPYSMSNLKAVAMVQMGPGPDVAHHDQIIAVWPWGEIIATQEPLSHWV